MHTFILSGIISLSLVSSVLLPTMVLNDTSDNASADQSINSMEPDGAMKGMEHLR